jgi:hypothetical protein
VGEIAVGIDTIFKPFVIERGAAGQVHVYCQNYKNRPYISIRNFFEAENGDMLPTKRGITVPLPFIGDLLAALRDQADRAIRSSMIEKEEIEEREEERLKVTVEGNLNEEQGKKVE